MAFSTVGAILIICGGVAGVAADDDCIKPGDTSWLDCIKGNQKYYLPPGTYYLDRHFQLPDNVHIEGAGTDQTIIEATKAVDNGCGAQAENPGNSKTRIGFVLGNNNYIGKFKFISKDTHRWQGYTGAALCGGAVFETPGCSDAYCKSENIGDARYNNGGVSNIMIDDVVIRGDLWQRGHSWQFTGPQLAVFVTQTKDLSRPSHGIHIRGVDMYHSWADGINLHGAVYDAVVEDCNVGFQGDDNFAVWSAGDLAHNITFRNNKASQHDSTNPNKYWGNCVAIYGGGSNINVLGVHCSGTADGGVKFSRRFGGGFSSKTSVLVQNVVVDNGKPACVDEDECAGKATNLPAVIDNCPKPAGSECLPVLDACFVHAGCNSGVGWSSDPQSSMGVGWYCADGVGVDEKTQYDTCCIHPGCGHAKYTGSYWACADTLDKLHNTSQTTVIV